MSWVLPRVLLSIFLLQKATKLHKVSKKHVLRQKNTNFTPMDNFLTLKIFHCHVRDIVTYGTFQKSLGCTKSMTFTGKVGYSQNKLSTRTNVETEPEFSQTSTIVKIFNMRGVTYGTVMNNGINFCNFNPDYFGKDIFLA